MLITDRIHSKKDSLKDLQERYKKIVNDIKELFFEHDDYFDKSTPMRPKSDTAIMSAAFCFANERYPRYKYALDIKRGEVWKSDPKAYLDYWLVYPADFDSHGNKRPAYVLRKKDIKILEDECKEVWKHAVNGKHGKLTVLGFNEWLDKTSCDEIVEVLHRIYEDRIVEVTEKKLFVKDIVIIYPERGFSHNIHKI